MAKAPLVLESEVNLIMKITIYELLRMIKDGKAPKKIKYNEKTYYYDKSFMNYACDLNDGDTLYLLEDTIEELVLQLNDTVEILEDKFTKEDFIKATMAFEDLTREEFNKIYEVKECNCGRTFCNGFIKVEKVQEEKKIPEKLDLYEDLQDILNSADESVVLNAIHKCLTCEKIKINEIIDYLKSKGE